MTRHLVPVGLIATLLVAALIVITRDSAEPLFHPGDVAQLGATGKPQFVEFFHPD